MRLSIGQAPDKNGGEIKGSTLFLKKRIICLYQIYLLYLPMKQIKLYKEVEDICKKEKIMEKHYGVESFPDNEPY